MSDLLFYRIVNTKNTGSVSSYNNRFKKHYVGKYFIGTKEEAKKASMQYHIILLKCNPTNIDKNIVSEMKFKYIWRGTSFHN